MAFIIHFIIAALGALIAPKGSRTQRYFFNTLVAYDQLGNVALFGGDPDETISSNTAKRQHVWFWRQLGRFLEFVDPGHLSYALEPDEGKDAVI